MPPDETVPHEYTLSILHHSCLSYTPNTQVIDFRSRADPVWAEIPIMKLGIETRREIETRLFPGGWTHSI